MWVVGAGQLAVGHTISSKELLALYQGYVDHSYLAVHSLLQSTPRLPCILMAQYVDAWCRPWLLGAHYHIHYVGQGTTSYGPWARLVALRHTTICMVALRCYH